MQLNRKMNAGYEEQVDTLSASCGTPYYERAPCGELGQYVKTFFYAYLPGPNSGYRNNPPGWFTERIVPFGCIDLVIQSEQVCMMVDPAAKKEILLPRVFITPMTTRHLFVKRNANVEIYGIRLHPWMNKYFTGQTMNRVVNSAAGAGVFFKKHEEELPGIFSMSPVEACDWLEQLLLSMVCNFRAPDQVLVNAIEFIIGEKGMFGNMDSLFSRYALTSRRVEQKFNETIGLSPKFYSRLIQFQHSVGLLNGNRVRSLVELVYECGYYDQAHFIRAFKEFSGVTPGVFSRENNPISRLMTDPGSMAFIINR